MIIKVLVYRGGEIMEMKWHIYHVGELMEIKGLVYRGWWGKRKEVPLFIKWWATGRE